MDPKHKIKFWFRSYHPSLNSIFRLQCALDKYSLLMMSRLLTIIQYQEIQPRTPKWTPRIINLVSFNIRNAYKVDCTKINLIALSHILTYAIHGICCNFIYKYWICKLLPGSFTIYQIKWSYVITTSVNCKDRCFCTTSQKLVSEIL